MFNAAVRVGYPPDELVGRYQPLLVAGMKEWPSFKVDFGSSNGMENAGLLDALNDMLLQCWRGYLEFFPCWPPSTSGSFAGMRARGAFTVSARYDAARAADKIGSIEVSSEAGVRCLFASPWPDAKDAGDLVVQELPGGKLVPVEPVQVRGARVFWFETQAGKRYSIGAKDLHR